MVLIRSKLATFGADYQVGLTGRVALAYDTFDGALGSLIQNQTPMSDGRNVWLDTNAQWEKTGTGEVRVKVNTGDPTYNNVLYCGLNEPRVVVSARIDMAGTYFDRDFGLTFNCADRNNNWRALVENGATEFRYSLRQIVNDQMEYNQTYAALIKPYVGTDVMSVVVDGDSWWLLRNNQVNSAVFTTVNRPLKNNGQHGLASNFNGQDFVEGNVPPPPHSPIPKAASALEFSVEYI